jgi:hypothetical protein
MPQLPRFRAWLDRYGAAEVIGTAAALVGAWTVRALTGNEILAAYGGSVGENVGYYGFIAARDLLADRRQRSHERALFRPARVVRVGSAMVTEFGPGELLDSAVVRPLLMGLGVRLLGPEAGVVAGKLAADLVFYSIVIGLRERRLRRG